MEMIVRTATTIEMYLINFLENMLTKVPIKSAARVPIKIPSVARELFMGYA